MIRWPVPAGCVLVLFCLPGCILLFSNECGGTKPSRDPEKAREWWTETLTRVDIETLREWSQASEQHLLKGSSALYERRSSPGHNMIGPVIYIQYFPTPIPDEYIEIVKDRLAEAPPPEESKQKVVIGASVVSFRKCSRDEAVEAWYGKTEK